MPSDSQLYQREEQKLKRKTPGEQERADLLGHRLDARLIFHLEKCVHSIGQTGFAR